MTQKKSALTGQPDYLLAFTVFMLLLLGVIMITSIGVTKSIALTKPADVLFPTCGVDGVDCYFLFKRHMLRLGIGAVAMLIAMKIPYRFWRSVAIPVFGIMFVMLIAVLLVGTTHNTVAKSWFLIYNNSIQPAEIAKIGLIFYFATWMERKGKDVEDLKDGFIAFCVITMLVILPVMLQPDLGSTLVFAVIMVAMYFMGGARIRHLLLGGLIALLIIGIVLPFHPYLKYRVRAYINPTEENCQPLAEGIQRDYCWQTNQSNIAVGSGGFFGKGLTQGIQKSNWLPQASDDFIFAASAEELGFLRIIFVVIAYGVIAYSGFRIANYAPDRFSMLVATGITTWIVGQAFINIGVNIGLMPVTGITLPFISYGGSSLISTLFGVGVLLNISKHTEPYASPVRRRRHGGAYAPARHSYRRT